MSEKLSPISILLVGFVIGMVFGVGLALNYAYGMAHSWALNAVDRYINESGCVSQQQVFVPAFDYNFTGVMNGS